MITNNESTMESILFSLQEESDRGCVIVAASILEDRITSLITKYLLPKEEKHDELLGSSRPVSTFSSKIDLGCRLGLYGDGDRKAFHIVRKMRNECAHEISATDFKHPSNINRTLELVDGYEEMLDYWWLKALEFENVKDALLEVEIDESNSGYQKIKELCGERQLFSFIAATMIFVVEDVTKILTPLKYLHDE